eukprot:CAMPEP_0168341762 /NCGR_PEP_ID=MMETSP0213-20121227/14920_1 /TAXON_ID=151035 /ORGANISM="Euplotes harpa, Strain FSP1.4" /LENGTH=61 /DNA_ID=CAMNT_0008348387 /DNA_START=968 /DNA_END=1149 /DNA_ORIENTATION=+
MNQDNISEMLKRKYEDTESPTKKNWKKNVLKDYAESTKTVETILLDSRNSRTRLERSLDDT